MSHRHPVLRQRKSRSLDEGRTTPRNPIYGSFVSVSPSRARSLSPHKRLPKQSVHINMNLTEYQMDRLADAISSHGSSPAHNGAMGEDDQDPPIKRPETERNGSEGTMNKSVATSRTRGLASREPSNREQDAGRHEKRSSVSTTSDLMPPPPPRPGRTQTAPATLAERRNQDAPCRIQVEDARKYGTHFYQSAGPLAAVQPLTPTRPVLAPPVDEVSSLYSQDEVASTPQRSPSRASPCRTHGNTVSQQMQEVMQSYGGTWEDPDYGFPPVTSWPPTNVSPVREASPVRDASPRRPRRHQEAKHRVETLKQQPQNGFDNGCYSPLMTYFAFEGVPVQKVGGKTLIGDQGWLERPGVEDKTPERQKKEKDLSPKKLGLLHSIKKAAKEMTESKTSRRPADKGHYHKAPKMTISLDPREQSLLYCELEFHVSNAIHAYITNELNHGRLDANKLKKIADGWAHKGRPKVVGFRYDLETQLELIDLHLEDFRFFGRRQGNPVEIAGLLYAMKVNARAMRVRTFCQPDSVVAKQLVDSQSLFNTIGCSEAQQIALAEIAQFFKVIVERERHYREQLSRQGRQQSAAAAKQHREQQEQQAHPGRRWDPPRGAAPPEGAPEVHGSSNSMDYKNSRGTGKPRGDRYEVDRATFHSD